MNRKIPALATLLVASTLTFAACSSTPSDDETTKPATSAPSAEATDEATDEATAEATEEATEGTENTAAPAAGELVTGSTFTVNLPDGYTHQAEVVEAPVEVYGSAADGSNVSVVVVDTTVPLTQIEASVVPSLESAGATDVSVAPSVSVDGAASLRITASVSGVSSTQYYFERDGKTYAVQFTMLSGADEALEQSVLASWKWL